MIIYTNNNRCKKLSARKNFKKTTKFINLLLSIYPEKNNKI